ncbi:hypothetical protein REPUB_Repub02eG0185300 [Reevesia pubescens]
MAEYLQLLQISLTLHCILSQVYRFYRFPTSQSSPQDLFTVGYVSAHATVSGWQNDLPLGTGFGLHLGLGSKNFV